MTELFYDWIDITSFVGAAGLLTLLINFVLLT